jgi:hypothetical protein
MVRDRHDDLILARPPRTLRQPADAAQHVGHVGDIPAVEAFRRESTSRTGPRKESFRASLRMWAGRVSGRSDRRLLFSLVRATDALATHLDLVVDRLNAQETITADVSDAFGGDITQLRAEVLQLRRLLTDRTRAAEE